MTAKKQTEITEITEIAINPEELLAIKLGFKFKNGKADIKTFRDTLVNVVLINSDYINDISQIDKAIKLYTSNGLLRK